jgi:hypothetical protein
MEYLENAEKVNARFGGEDHESRVNTRSRRKNHVARETCERSFGAVY